VLRVFTEGIHQSDADLSLFYDFDEGTGAHARNQGRAGGKYDLVLGRSDVGGPIAYEVANKYGGVELVPFMQPVWSLVESRDLGDGLVDRCVRKQLPPSVASKPQPTGYGGNMFVTLKESSSIRFILEYFHPAGLKSFVRITRPPLHGCLEQVICAGSDCNRTQVASAAVELSSSAYASLVRCCDRVPPFHAQRCRLRVESQL
jgi:hypothetical protein